MPRNDSATTRKTCFFHYKISTSFLVNKKIPNLSFCSAITTMNKRPEAKISATRRKIRRNGRTIGYTIIEAEKKDHRSTAVVIFFPVSGSSHVLSRMILQGYRCSVLAVDRPRCGATAPLERAATSSRMVRPGCCYFTSTTSTIDPNEN
jgi:hypothetical protein